jgi:hypothetical protein
MPAKKIKTEEKFDFDQIDNKKIVNFCYNKKYEIIEFCVNNKIKIPQAALYLCLTSGNTYLCDLCLMGDCVIDKYCMAMAVKLLDIEMIKYCKKYSFDVTDDMVDVIFSSQHTNYFRDMIKNYNKYKSDQEFVEDVICNAIYAGDFYRPSVYGKYGEIRVNELIIELLLELKKEKIYFSNGKNMIKNILLINCHTKKDFQKIMSYIGKDQQKNILEVFNEMDWNLASGKIKYCSMTMIRFIDYFLKKNDNTYPNFDEKMYENINKCDDKIFSRMVICNMILNGKFNIPDDIIMSFIETGAPNSSVAKILLQDKYSHIKYNQKTLELLLKTAFISDDTEILAAVMKRGIKLTEKSILEFSKSQFIKYLVQNKILTIAQ